MSETLSDQELEHLKRLARLTLNPHETQKLRGDLNAMLDSFAALNDLDLAGLPEMPRPIALENVMREDVVQEGFSQSEALALGVSSEDGFFKTPRIVESDS